MKYKNISRGIFIDRPNRFIANVEINGEIHVCHVKNTGRCKELLIKGSTVYLERSDNPLRKTEYDLIAVQKGEKLINIDSQAPNKAVREWLEAVKPFGEDMEIYPEFSYGNSRLDFLLKSNKTDRKLFLEVKGCTLEENGAVYFPDAPTLRGIKHLDELIKCTEAGSEAAILMLIQMNNVKYFSPNYKTHPEFGEKLKEAKKKGVKILCFDCNVTGESLTVGNPVPIKLECER